MKDTTVTNTKIGGLKPSTKQRGKAKTNLSPIRQIVCLPYGLESPRLKSNVPHTKSNEFDHFLTAGLATNPAENLPLEFNIDWGTKQMNAFFRAQLPNLFNYFTKLYPDILTIEAEPDNVGTPLDDILWPYSLCRKSGKGVEVLETAIHPNAKVYLDKSSSRPANRGSWTERVIYLLSKEAIPEKVWKEWGESTKSAKTQSKEPTASKIKPLTQKSSVKSMAPAEHVITTSGLGSDSNAVVSWKGKNVERTKRLRSPTPPKTLVETDIEDSSTSDSDSILTPKTRPKPRKLSTFKFKKLRTTSPNQDASFISDSIDVLSLSDPDATLPLVQLEPSGSRTPYAQLSTVEKLRANPEAMELSSSLPNYWSL